MTGTPGTPATGIPTARLAVTLPLLFVPAVLLGFTPLAPEAVLAFVGVVPAAVGLLHGRRRALAAALVTALPVAVVELANPSCGRPRCSRRRRGATTRWPDGCS